MGIGRVGSATLPYPLEPEIKFRSTTWKQFPARYRQSILS